MQAEKGKKAIFPASQQGLRLPHAPSFQGNFLSSRSQFSVYLTHSQVFTTFIFSKC